jgi:preprotein translocase subunit SecB
MSLFKIEELYFDSLRFRRTPEAQLEADSEMEVEQRFGIKHSFNESRLSVNLELEISQKSLPFILNADIVGLFSFEERPADEELSRVVHVNCAAILFPFLREAVADLTRKGGFPPLILPPVNFVEVFKQVKSQITSTSEGNK